MINNRQPPVVQNIQNRPPMMTQPTPAPPPTALTGNNKPNAAKIESIKNYYYQLSASLKSVSAQLQQPNLTPGRRQALLLQQDRLQGNLNEFTEKVH